jgi:predicted DNA-binding protein
MVIETKEIKIDSEILNKISKIAKDENKTENKVLNEIIEKGLEDKNKIKIPDYLIANKDTYNPDPKRFLESAGIIKGCKPFNAVKLVREVRSEEYDIP